MNNTSAKLSDLNEAISDLAKNSEFKNAKKTINTVLSLLQIQEDELLWRTKSSGKIKSNAGWFMMAEGFADRRAAYTVSKAEDNNKNIDVHGYWLKKQSKAVISWLTALTSRFEDESFYTYKNIGIDFVIPEIPDRIIVILSKNYVIRTLELHKNLTNTQQEIFNKWLQDFDFTNKAQVHETLWDSFNLESVNKNFYKEISRFFIELSQHLSDKKLFHDGRHATLFANRLIGRLIFCWFLDKKGFINSEQKYFDTEGKKSTEYYELKLEKLFFRTLNTKIKDRTQDVVNLMNEIDEETPFLNGGLFTPKDDDHFGEKVITFPNDYFDRFYEFLNKYNFTTDESTSSFQQVAIDPEMLGRIFENLLAEQVEETGEQARKAKGAFYTPREIVDYMCKESLRGYLKSKIEEGEQSEKCIELLLDKKPHEWRDQQRNYRDDIKQYKYDILKVLDEIKILDPACGSGAFPIGMLQLLLETYERLESSFDPYKKKIEIIKNNLFGVDIEPMAVEIARLRSWLSIIVDEDLNPKAENMGVHPLPNLDFKFICANSLISAPEEKENGWIENGFFDELEEKSKEFFEITDSKKKEQKKKELEKLIRNKIQEKYDNMGVLSTGLNMGVLTDEIKKKNKKGLDENERLADLWDSYKNIFTADKPVGFFETKYFFPSAKEGFDMVIANPPYIRQEKIKDQKPFLQHYKVYNSTSDLYTYFYEISHNLLCQKGILTFISSNKWMRAKYGDKLRQFFKENTKISQIIDFGGHKVFEATVDTNIIILQKEEVTEDYQVPFVNIKPDFKKGDDLEKYLAQNQEKIKLKHLKNSGWSLTDEKTLKIKEKIERIGTPLKKWDVKIYRGVITGLNEAFIIDTPTKEKLCKEDPKSAEILKPLLRGRDIKRYCYEWNEKWLIIAEFGSYKFLANKYPAIHEHLLQYEDKLKKRGQVQYNRASAQNIGKDYQGQHHWLELDNNPTKNYLELFEKEKLAWPMISTTDSTFTQIPSSTYLNNKCYFITGSNIKFILAVLNSKLAWFLFNNQESKLGEKGVEIRKEGVENFPIPKTPKSEQQPFIDLVNQILATKKSNPDADTTILEQKIDELVYDLYGLEDEEIKIIEDNK